MMTLDGVPNNPLLTAHAYFLVATANAADGGLVWDFVSAVGGGTTNGQSFNSPTSGGWDSEWTYYVAYQIQGTNP